MTYPIYSQRDPEYAGLKLGANEAQKSSTIGDYGCAITSIAQKLSIMGFLSSPVLVQTALKVNRAFGGRTANLVMWGRVTDAFPQLTYNGRYDKRPLTSPLPAAQMKMIRDRLVSGNPVIVYVDAIPFGGLDQHFVLIEAELESGFVILNPWNGKRESLRAYGKTDEIAICGCVWLDPSYDKVKAA